MKIFLAFCCTVATITFQTSSGRSETVQSPSKEYIDAKSLTTEQLPIVINLPNCPWIRITEWRTSSKNSRGGPSDEAKKVLDDICVKSVKGFSSFIKMNKWNISFDSKTFHQSLCLMPALKNDEGLEPRNLNDYIFRFKNRQKTYDGMGNPDILWGYTDFNTDTIYMRNDFINIDGSVNKKVVTVFAHEIYHALSWQYQINDIYHNDPKVEENMAMSFTKFLGYGK